MKTKKLHSILMSIVMIIGLLQGNMVLAADSTTDIITTGNTDYYIMDTTSESFDESITEYSLWVGGEQFTSDKLTINGTTGTASYNPDSNTLTLSDYSYTGEGYEYNSETGLSAAIYSKDDLSIVLMGNSSLTNTSENGDGVAFGRSLTISGEGALVICSYDGIYSTEGNVTINGGTLDIVGDNYGIYASSVKIENGIVRISGENHGIYAAGSVNIKCGTVNITGGDYGIFGYRVTIEGGRVEITGDYVIGAYELIVSDDMAIILPVNGKLGDIDIGFRSMTILHETGDAATFVLLTQEKNHNWSEDFTVSNTHHWHTCTDADCFINDYPEACEGYEKHTIAGEGENGVCSVCILVEPAINGNGVSGSKATATVTIQEKGTYAVIFADYEGTRLNTLDVVRVTVTEDNVGIITVPSEKDITLSTGDKIMLWSYPVKLVPKCKPYIVD